MNLPARGQLFVVTVVVAGLAVICSCIYGVTVQPVSSRWLLLGLLTLLSGSFTVKVPALQARLSVSETFVFTSFLLFGTNAGTLTVVLDTLVATLGARRRTHEPLRILFNLAAPALSIWTASGVFSAAGGVAPLGGESVDLPQLLAPMFVMTAVYFLLNSGLVAAALSFERGQSAFLIWRKNFLWLSVNYFGGASVAGLLVSYTRTVDLTAFGIIVPLLVISYLTFKTSLGRIEDADRHVEEVRGLLLSTIETLATAIDAKDQVTHGHIRRVQQYTLGLARALGVTNPMQLKAIEAAALLHDMGKLVVPEHILNKPGKLTPGEFEKMKLHASVGADILSPISFPYPVVPIVRHHHEYWDGKGYPDGLRGTQIPLGARVLAVVDCFDALTSDRPYRSKLTDEDAVGILMQRRGSMYDPLVVDKFLEVKDELAKNLENQGEYLVSRTSIDVQPAARGPTASLEVLTALRTVLTSVQQDLPVGSAFVYLRELSTDEVIAIEGLGELSSAIIGTRISVGSRVSGWVAANGRAIFNADSRLDQPELAALSGSVCVACPIKIRNAIVGVLTLHSETGRVFDGAAIAFVERIVESFEDEPLASLVSGFGSQPSDSFARRLSVH